MWLIAFTSLILLVPVFAFVYGEFFYFDINDWSATTIFSRVLFLLVGGYTLYLYIRHIKPVITYLRGKEQYTVTDGGLVINGYTIAWTDIKGFQLRNQSNLSKSILVEVQDPDKYLAMAKGRDKKQMQTSMKLLNTPFVIPAYSKYFSDEDILKNLEYEFKKQQYILDFAKTQHCNAYMKFDKNNKTYYNLIYKQKNGDIIPSGIYPTIAIEEKGKLRMVTIDELVTLFPQLKEYRK